MAYLSGRHERGWQFERRMQAVFPNQPRIGGFEYDEELAGPDGMHFHFWVPRGTLKEAVRSAAREAMRQRDLVSYSWDFIPEGNDPLVVSPNIGHGRDLSTELV